MKETIEWYFPADQPPNHEEEVLMRLPESEAKLYSVIHGTYSKFSGFRSIWGNHHNPIAWTRIPKGPQ